MQYSWQSQDKIVRSLGAGVISACLFLLLMASELLILTPLAMLPLFYSGFRDGYRNSGLASIFATFILMCSGNIYVAILFAIIFGLPVFGISYTATTNCHDTAPVDNIITTTIKTMLGNKTTYLPGYFTDSAVKVNSNNRYWYSYGYIISIIAQISLVITVVFTVLISKIYNQSELLNIYNNFQTLYKDNLSISHITFENFLKIYRLVPGFIGIFFLSSYMMTGLFSQFILVSKNQNIRPTFDTAEFKLPIWLWVNLLLWTIVCLLCRNPFLSQLSMNVVLVLLTVFMLQGMSIIYVFCQQLPYKILWLVGFCFLTLRLPWMTIFVVSIGVFEPWLEWRQKIKNNIRS